MKVIGLTGSMASGKSTVATMLRDEGVAVFDSDAVVHELYMDPDFAAALQKELGLVISNGAIDRSKLTKRLLEDPTLLPKLESRVHPVIRSMRDKFVAEHDARGDTCVVVDVPLLFETGAHAYVDASMVVIAPEATRHSRVMVRPGMTEEKSRTLDARQWPQERKRALATYVIENDGSLADLRTKVKAAIKALTSPKGSRHA
jgi:dephospho-CoA kinase